MPKTRNAFALKDFDRARILQRPYFKDFNFDKNLTDEKILSSLSAQIGDSIPELERKNETLSKIRSRLHEYAKRIEKHTDKIRLWGSNKSEQSAEYSRAFGLTIDLALINAFLRNFFIAVTLSLKKSESTLRKRYRDRFAERLKEIRKEGKLSRRELAERLGYKPSGFAELESGRNEPNLTTLIRLSQELNTSADWLLGLK